MSRPQRSASWWTNGDTQPVIEELSADTINGVHERLLAGASFADLVSRECEMDALFTLIDIAITAPPARSSHVRSHLEPHLLLRLRDLIFLAHDETHGDNIEAARALLKEAAELLAGSTS